jgi:hypothetical protein
MSHENEHFNCPRYGHMTDVSGHCIRGGCDYVEKRFALTELNKKEILVRDAKSGRTTRLFRKQLVPFLRERYGVRER